MLLDRNPIFVGELSSLPRGCLGPQILMIMLRIPSNSTFALDVVDVVRKAFEQSVRGREALWDDFYHHWTLVFITEADIARWPLLLAEKREAWIVVPVLFSGEATRKGNWAEPHDVVAAKEVLGAQIGRVERLATGALGRVLSDKRAAKNVALSWIGGHLTDHLSGSIRNTGRRANQDDWSAYIERLYHLYGSPHLRHLYAEPLGTLKLKVTENWLKEGRLLPGPAESLVQLVEQCPLFAKEERLLITAIQLFARASIRQSEGIIPANGANYLGDDEIEIIVDNHSEPDLDALTVTARRWGINPGYFFDLYRPMIAHFDAARSIGVFERLARVELMDFASFGIRGLLNHGDHLFDETFAPTRRSLRGSIPHSLAEAARLASREWEDLLAVELTETEMNGWLGEQFDPRKVRP